MIVNGSKVDENVTNAAFLSRLKDSNTVGVIDLEEIISTLSGASVFNIQRHFNSFSSFTGVPLNGVFDLKPTWASDIVGSVNDDIKTRVEALVDKYTASEVTGHLHDGTDGNGPKVRYTNLNTPQSDNSSTGNIDALPTAALFTVRLTGVTQATLRGIADPDPGRVVSVFNTTLFDLDIINDDATPLVTEKIITGTGDDITIQSGGAVSLQYDGTSLVWRVVSGPGGKNTVGWQEIPGVVTPLNVYGPLTFTPVNDESVIAYVDGLKQNINVDFTYDDILKEITFINPLAVGQGVCVSYVFQTNGSTVTIAGSGTTNKVDKRILSAGDITAKKVTLSFTPTSTGEVILDIIGGTAQSNGTDFIVSGDELSWDSLNLDGLLSASDELRIFYWY